MLSATSSLQSFVIPPPVRKTYQKRQDNPSQGVQSLHQLLCSDQHAKTWYNMIGSARCHDRPSGPKHQLILVSVACAYRHSFPPVLHCLHKPGRVGIQFTFIMPGRRAASTVPETTAEVYGCSGLGRSRPPREQPLRFGRPNIALYQRTCHDWAWHGRRPGQGRDFPIPQGKHCFLISFHCEC